MKSKLDIFAKATPHWDTPLIIEVAINGGRTKEMNSHAPTTHQAIAQEAIACADAGAGIIHSHNTDICLKGEESFNDYQKIWKQVLEQRPDIFWYGTTSVPHLLTPEEHGLEHVELLHKELGVRLASIDCGLENLPFALDENGYLQGFPYGFSFDRIARQVEMCHKNDMGMVWGIYEPSYLRTALSYINRGMSTKGSSIDLYLAGDYGLVSTQPVNTACMPPTVESLYYYLHMLEGCTLPWYLSIYGAGEMDLKPLMRRAIELGGHIKTGIELYYSPKSQPSNLELLQEVQQIAKEVGRPVATQQQVKAILKLD